MLLIHRSILVNANVRGLSFGYDRLILNEILENVMSHIEIDYKAAYCLSQPMGFIFHQTHSVLVSLSVLVAVRYILLLNL